MAFKERAYQREMDEKIQRAWSDPKIRDVLAVLPTGAGKTVLVSNIIERENGASAFVAHRQELVGQISLALARNAVRHRVIGPVSVQRVCVALHMAELGQNFVDPTARAAAVGIDTLVRMDQRDPWLASVGLVVTDECFPAGTLIGDTPIEDVRVGDVVDAFDERDGTMQRRRVVRLFNNPAPREMVRVRAGSHVLECTKGHPFYTLRGWVNACDLNEQDQLSACSVHSMRDDDRDDGGVAEIPLSQDRPDFLPAQMRQRLPGGDATAAHSSTASVDPLPHVCEAGQHHGLSDPAVQEHGACVLQPGVFERLSVSEVFRDDARDQREARGRVHGAKPETADDRDACADQRKTQSGWASAESAWGQRSTTDARGDGAGIPAHAARLRDATRHPDEDGEGVGLPAGVQARCGALDAQGGDRGGRPQPQQSPASGCEERRLLEWVGVDSVEVFERADFGRSGDSARVYNFEVEELHTYVANGIVVHNCHHLLRDNKWGKGRAMFKNARGLGVTATPVRSDGKGLGRHADGIFDVMIEGIGMRELIGQGFLTEYRIFAPPSDLDLSDVGISASGDFSPPALRKAVHRSRIVGDVVENYLRIARGKLGVTFAVDIESATEICAAYRAGGVPAEVVTGNTPDTMRQAIMRRFRNREVLQLTNCDLFGEGFDLPAIEVVSMARPTQSFGLYCQQFGRALRPLEGKERAILIDHAGNVERFAKTRGLPDTPQVWTLDRRERSGKSKPSDADPTRTCTACAGSYRIIEFGRTCPYCGVEDEPAGRGTPAQVDGLLEELDPEVLRALRREVERVDGPAPRLSDPAAARGAQRNHIERQRAQQELRATLALWGGWQDAQGRSAEQAQRAFFVRYGMTGIEAAALGAAEARALQTTVRTELERHGIIDATVNSETL